MNIKEMTHLKHHTQSRVLSIKSNQLLGFLGLGAPHGEANRKSSSYSLFPPLAAPCHHSGALPGLSSAQAPSRQQALASGNEEPSRRDRAAQNCQQSAGEEGVALWGLCRTAEALGSLLLPRAQGITAVVQLTARIHEIMLKAEL